MTKKRFSCVTSENYSNNFADFFEQQGSGSWTRTAGLLSCFVLKSTRLPAIFSILNKSSILFKILAFLRNGITTCFCPCIQFWTSHSKAVLREILQGDDQSERSPRFALWSPSSRKVNDQFEAYTQFRTHVAFFPKTLVPVSVFHRKESPLRWKAVKIGIVKVFCFWFMIWGFMAYGDGLEFMVWAFMGQALELWVMERLWGKRLWDSTLL